MVFPLGRGYSNLINHVMIDYSRHLPANPHRETSNLISEKSPYLLKVNTQFYMETDGKRMFTVKKIEI